jgi:hypothetical protein
MMQIHKTRPDVHAACHAHSVAGKAFSVFGKPLDMMTQDALRFYKSHAVYTNFGGVVLDREEGERIGKALGNGKAVILQNHGLLTVSSYLVIDKSQRTDKPPPLALLLLHLCEYRSVNQLMKPHSGF